MATQRVFYSYSHEDRSYCQKLRKHLALLERSGIIVSWFDREILPGSDWAYEIDEHLNQSEMVLLLVSANFISSDYCFGKEMARALERHDAEECLVIPIFIKPVDYSGAPFARLQMLPSNGRPAIMWKPQDAAWEDTAKGVRKVAETLGKGIRISRPKSGAIILPSHASPPLSLA